MRIEKISKKTIKEAVKIIKNGGVVACPTDTVYGLIADATDKNAVKKIFDIKKREKGKAISIFLEDIDSIKKFAFLNKKQKIFLKKYLPGKFTIILKRKKPSELPNILFGGKNTIGIRIVKNKLINYLIKELKKPLTATSFNISKRESSGKINEIIKQFKNISLKPDLVIKKDKKGNIKPSKIIDLTKDKPIVLRK